MKKFIFFIAITIFFVEHSQAQQQLLDSLQKVVLKMKKNTGYEKDTIYLNTLHELGYAYYATNLDSMRIVALKFKELSEKIAYKKGTSRALQDLGLYYYGNGNYTKALELLLEGLRIAEIIQDSKNIGSCYNNIALIYQSQNKNEKALQYHFKALELSKSNKNKTGEASAYNNIGHIYGELKRHYKALENHFESLKINEKIQDRQGLAYNYTNIGSQYRWLKLPDEALLYLDKAYKLAEKIGDKDITSEILLNLAEVYIQLKDFEKALLFSKKGLKLAYELNQKEGIRNNYETLSKVYEVLGDYQKALESYKLSKIHQDSLVNNETMNKMQQLQLQYEYEKKETIWKIEQDKRLTGQRIYTFSFIIAFTFAIVFMFFLYRNQQHVVRKNHTISEQKVEIENQNAELEAQAEHLRDINALKDRLFSIIGHDLKSPLNQIKGILSIMESGDITMEEFKHISGGIKQNLYHASELLDNLFEWAASQLGGETVNPIHFDLHQVVANNLELYEQAAEHKKIIVENNLIPKTMVWADMDMIDLVVRNLLSNALKFCKADSSIIFSTSNSNTFVTLCVKDTGVGIDNAILPTLFGEGHGSVLGTAGEKGTGLGLTLCHDFVQKNGGKIWVESTIGVGSKFYFTVPIEENSPNSNRV